MNNNMITKDNLMKKEKTINHIKNTKSLNMKKENARNTTDIKIAMRGIDNNILNKKDVKS